MAPIEIEKMLNVLSLRKEKGYSQFELSFLMGQRDFYVRDIENPKLKLVYTPQFSNILRQIFDCEIQAIIPDTNRRPGYSIRILEATDESGKFVYHAEILEENGSWKPIDNFSKDESKSLLLNSPSTITEQEVKDWVESKFISDYFDAPKTALKIFKDCEKDLDRTIRPMHLATSLQEYTKKKKSLRLVKEKNTDSLFIFAKD